MARNKEPVDLILAKGKSHHLTKKVIEERRESEVKAAKDNIKPPSYLNRSQKTKFKKIAKELIELDIMSNLDCDALARYIIALDIYISLSRKLQENDLNSLQEIDIKNEKKLAEAVEKLDEVSKIQDRYFKQCRMAASDLGLTITSRCRLVVPKAPEPKKNKFDKFNSG
jgi:P27 family predicted phage terminase small subunit